MRRYTIVTVLVSMILMTFGCGKPGKQAGSSTASTGSGPQPPAIELRSAKPIDIPATALPEAGKVPIYLRVRDPQKTVGRVGEWTSATQPTMTPQSIAQNIESSGIPLSKFEAGKNALVGVWPEPNRTRVGGVLPLPADADISQLGLQTEALPAGGLLFGADPNGQGLQQAKSVGEDLVKMQQAPMQSDLELGVDVKSQWAIYGPMVRMMLPGIMNNISSMQQQGRSMPQGIQAVMNAYIAAGMDLLDQTKNVTLRGNFDKEVIEVSFVLEGRGEDGGTTLTAALGKDPVSAPELTQYLARNQTSGQFTIRDMGKFTETIIRYLGQMNPSDPEFAAKMRQQFTGAEKVGAVHIGIGMNMTPDSPMRAEYVMVADNPDAFVQLMREKMGLVNSGPLHDFYKSLDMDMRITTEPLKRDYKGYSIESYKMSCTPGADASETDRQMMAKMFPGEVPIEFVQVGKYILSSVGQKVDGIVDRLLTPEGKTPAQSVKEFPAGGMFYFDYDVIGYMRGISEAMPNVPKMNLPEDAPPLLIAGYHQQGKAYYIVRIPLGFVTALGKMNETEPAPAATPAS